VVIMSPLKTMGARGSAKNTTAKAAQGMDKGIDDTLEGESRSSTAAAGEKEDVAITENASNTRRWIVSDAARKMFYMERGAEGNVVVSHEVKGKVVFARLEPKFDAPNDYGHSLQLTCDKTEIESINKFFEIMETYHACQSRPRFYLPFSMDKEYVKLKNNDVRFKNHKFPNIDNEMETMLEPEDITRGAIVSLLCSPHFYEYSRRNKDEEDKSKSSNIEERKEKKIGGTRFESDGYSLCIDHISWERFYIPEEKKKDRVVEMLLN
jgi:hypothetical protein